MCKYMCVCVCVVNMFEYIKVYIKNINMHPIHQGFILNDDVDVTIGFWMLKMMMMTMWMLEWNRCLVHKIQRIPNVIERKQGHSTINVRLWWSTSLPQTSFSLIVVICWNGLFNLNQDLVPFYYFLIIFSQLNAISQL